MSDQPIPLYYEEHGAAGMPSGNLPLVLLHGFPLDHTIWNPVVPLLERQTHLILPDLRGHGRSEAPEGGYSMLLMASDVLALLDKLSIRRAILAGHSMGGYISLAFARAYPDRLAGLALVASNSTDDSPDRRQGRYVTVIQVSQEGSVVVADSMPQKMTPDARLATSLRQIILRTQPQGIVGALIGMAEREDSTGLLSALDVPVLVIAGQKDVFVPPERARVMAGQLKFGSLVEIAGAAHMPMMEAPQQVAEALIRLVQDCQVTTAG